MPLKHQVIEQRKFIRRLERMPDHPNHPGAVAERLQFARNGLEAMRLAIIKVPCLKPRTYFTAER